MKARVERRTGRKNVRRNKRFVLNLDLKANERLVNFEAEKNYIRSRGVERVTDTWDWVAYVEVKP